MVEFKKVRKRKPTSVTQNRSGIAFAPAAAPTTQPATKKTASARLAKLSKKKAIIVLVGAGCLVAGLVIHNYGTNSNADAKKPAYQTVLPKGKTITQLGGWKRVSPPKMDPVFAYIDAIDGVPVSVSEQPLPATFKNGTADQVADLAKKFNATDKIDAGTTAVYVGTSAKGPQSVIFVKNNLLVLIKSEKKVGDTSWAKYAQLLN